MAEPRSDKAFPVSWDQFHRDSRALAWRLSGQKANWQAIVCVTRAGWCRRRSSPVNSASG